MIGTILVHAAWIILFAPVRENEDTEYSRSNDYDHRSPSTFSSAVDIRTLSKKFSTAGMNRAVFMIYLLQRRYVDPAFKAEQTKANVDTDCVASHQVNENFALATRQKRIA
ncbi:hypothetical protein EDB80DRAFT_819494 [Ilyonectria destructans]|nr:hypothetical protein EDB80DRAFT_819494 [Ilyonectria destructans]